MPISYRVSYISGGAGFLPSTVVSWESKGKLHGDHSREPVGPPSNGGGIFSEIHPKFAGNFQVLEIYIGNLRVPSQCHTSPRNHGLIRGTIRGLLYRGFPCFFPGGKPKLLDKIQTQNKNNSTVGE